MSDEIPIHLVHPSNKTQIAKQIKDDLENVIDNSSDINIKCRDKIVKIPDVSDIDPLSVILLLLPENESDFGNEEENKVRGFRQQVGQNENRLVPINLFGIDPPNIVQDLKNFDLSNPSQNDYSDDIKRLAILTENLTHLRVSASSRRVFISYKQSDGKKYAEELQSELEDRGYDVWRDEMKNRDNLTQIPPGSKIEQTIKDAIIKQGFLLVVDTYEAPVVTPSISTPSKQPLPVTVRRMLPEGCNQDLSAVAPHCTPG